MHRLNLTIDETLYEQARAVSFIEKKSISQMIRESLSEYIAKNAKTKQQEKLEKEIAKLSGMLSNERFVANAPASVIEENKAGLAAAEDKLEKVLAELKSLS